MPLFQKKEHSCRPLIQIWQFCLIKWIWRGFGMFYFYMRRGLGMIIWSARCILCIYFDACPAMPHAIVFRENSRTCRKIQRNLLWFKRNHFQDSSMDTHRPVSSLTTHPIYCVYHAKSIYIFFCKHRPGLDAKFKNSKLSHRMCAAHAWNIKSRRNKKLIA